MDVDLLDVTPGSTVKLDRVLLLADGEKVTVGTPTVEGASVLATSLGNDRAEKVIVFKYKQKTRYTRKKGHKQPFTSLSIEKILTQEPAQA